MLLDAKAVSYPNPAGGAAAGVSFEATLKQLGIADQIEAKIKKAQEVALKAMALAAKGEVDVGLTFMSEMQDPGIDCAEAACLWGLSPPSPAGGRFSLHSGESRGGPKRC